MRLDLGGVRVELQAQLVFDEGAGVFFPVDLRVGRQVRVVVTDGAVDLAHQRHGSDLRNLALEAVDDVGHLFAQGGRRGWLAVGARQHRHVGMLVGKRTDRFGDLAHQRQQHVITARAQHQRVGQVVDVLAGAGEVDELADVGQLRQLCSLLLEQVLDGLDVVVGGAFDFLDALGVGQLEIAGQGIENGVGLGRECRHFTDLRVSGQALQPAHFDQGAETDQAVFAENRAQGLGFAGVAAVYGETAVSEESCMGCSRTVRLLEGAYHT